MALFRFHMIGLIIPAASRSALIYGPSHQYNPYITYTYILLITCITITYRCFCNKNGASRRNFTHTYVSRFLGFAAERILAFSSLMKCSLSSSALIASHLTLLFAYALPTYSNNQNVEFTLLHVRENKADTRVMDLQT